MRKRQVSTTLDKFALGLADTVEEKALGEMMMVALYRTPIAPNAYHTIVIFLSILLT